MADTRVEWAERPVIENALISALDDASKVGLILNKQDLSYLISMLELVSEKWLHEVDDAQHHYGMLRDLKRLREAVFPAGNQGPQ